MEEPGGSEQQESLVRALQRVWQGSSCCPELLQRCNLPIRITGNGLGGPFSLPPHISRTSISLLLQTHTKREIFVVPISWCPLLLTQSLKQGHKQISSFSASGGRAHMGAHILYTQTFKSCEPKLLSTK